MGFQTPNRIVLISRGRHDEAKATADAYPGMALALSTDSLGFMTAAPLTVAGGGGQLCVVKEDALQGSDITQKLASGNVIPFCRAARGDELLMLLQVGQNVAAEVGLMSAGDGTLVATPSDPLVNIITPSTAVGGNSTFTTFSNGSLSIPANTLKAGDVLRVHAKMTATGQNSTDTTTGQILLGTNTIATSGAIPLAANQGVLAELTITCRSIGATGAFIASGFISGTDTTTPASSSSATMQTTEGQGSVSFTLDTTTAETLKVNVKHSSTNAGNTTILDEYNVRLNRPTGLNTLVFSAEAIDNSASTGTSGFNTAAFIRVFVP